MNESSEIPIPAAWPAAGGIKVNAAARQWLLKRGASLEDLWDNMDEGDFDEDHIPYWAEVWPASLLLADWLWRKRAEIAGRICLDLGCGLGLTAMVGQSLGARVLAVDYERDAICHTMSNAQSNGVGSPLAAVMDWRRPALRRGSISRIWAADILYEKRHMRPILEFLTLALPPAGKAWLASPRRAIFYDFLDLAKTEGWRIKMAMAGAAAGPYSRTGTAVCIWELEPAR